MGETKAFTIAALGRTLIDRDRRIAQLTAEVERLTAERDAAVAETHQWADQAETEAQRQKQRDAALSAAKTLLERLDSIHEDGAYQAVWNIYTVHSGQYKGPTYVEELAALRTTLAEPEEGK
jgi:hypothetical protein